MVDTSSLDKSGFDRAGFDAISPIRSGIVYPAQTTINQYPIKIADDSCNYKGIIFTYSYFGWTRRLYEPDGFTLELNTNSTYSDHLSLGNYILFSDFEDYIGYIEDVNYVQDERTQTLTINGRDPSGLLQNRIALYGTNSGTGYDDQSGNAETVILHYINENAIDATDASRNINGLGINTDEGRGEFVSYSARFQTLDEIVNTLSVSGELGYKTVFDKTECKGILTFIEGTDHSYTSENPVIFKNDFHNIISLNINKSIVNNVNLAYVGDNQEDASRVLTEVYINTEPSGNDRIELFVDGSDTTTEAERTTLGQSEIIQNQTEISIAAEINPGPDSGFTYGVDYDLGDIVSLEFEDTIYDLRIVQVLLEFDRENRKKVTLTLGKPLRSFVKDITNKTGPTAQERI